MRASYYSRALRLAIKEHPHSEEKLLKQFVETVAANGHTHLLSKVVRSFEKLTQKDEKESTIVVTSATQLSEERTLELLKKEPFKHALSTSHKKVIRTVDDSIVGGVVVRTGSVRIDGSHKRALLNLYQSLTSS
jgi:ATP synthase F1 delta subunit